MRNITPDPSKNSFTEKISRTVSKKPTVAESLSSKLSGIKSIGETFTQSQQQNNTITPNDSGIKIIGILLIILIVTFLAYNAYLYFYEGTDIFQKFFGIVLFKTGEGTKNVFKTSGDGAKKVIDVTEKGGEKVGQAVADIGRNVEERSSLKQAIEKPKKKEKNIDADDSTESNIQHKKTSGYCYIGSDRGYRTCVKMTDDNTCVSGKIFPSKDICVNPNLRR
tara:strand:+ start:883 stop:1548 length:666 start_codon:yes stop_codon:yes gene_type:complete